MFNSRGFIHLVSAACTLMVLQTGSPALAAPAADTVFIHAKIYLGGGAGGEAQALALREDRIVFVGTSSAAAAWVGPSTRVIDAAGARVLPGLVDAHIHPLDIVDLDVCDLDSEPVTLRQLSAFVKQCLARYGTAPGARLIVHQWNHIDGNQPDDGLKTLRAALDAASTSVQIQLLGNDGHHGAFNSLALASARNAAGQIVGLSKITLDGELSHYRQFVGVDERGEPNGAANEDARYLINTNSMLNTDLDEVMKAPGRVAQRLNSVGITAILDAMTSPDSVVAFDAMQQRGQLTFRAQLAQFYDPAQHRLADGRVDYDAMVNQAIEIRAKYAANPLIRADFIKLFADGVLEGNPYATPPTLPNGASLKDFLQPIFAVDARGMASVTGYVDMSSAPCRQVRADAGRYASADSAAQFAKQNGFQPAQCVLSNGLLQHDRAVILEFVRRFHLAGFNLHIHVIGDRALRTALRCDRGRARRGRQRSHPRQPRPHSAVHARGRATGRQGSSLCGIHLCVDECRHGLRHDRDPLPAAGARQRLCTAPSAA